MNVLVREVSALYPRRKERRVAARRLSIQYADFARMAAGLAEGEALETR